MAEYQKAAILLQFIDGFQRNLVRARTPSTNNISRFLKFYRWRTTAILHIEKLRYFGNGMTDRSEIWHGDAF